MNAPTVILRRLESKSLRFFIDQHYHCNNYHTYKLLLTPECNVLEFYCNFVIFYITRVTKRMLIKMNYNFYVYKIYKRVIKFFFKKKNTKYNVKICFCIYLNVSLNTFLNCNQPKQTTA